MGVVKSRPMYAIVWVLIVMGHSPFWPGNGKIMSTQQGSDGSANSALLSRKVRDKVPEAYFASGARTTVREDRTRETEHEGSWTTARRQLIWNSVKGVSNHGSRHHQSNDSARGSVPNGPQHFPAIHKPKMKQRKYTVQTTCCLWNSAIRFQGKCIGNMTSYTESARRVRPRTIFNNIFV